MSRRYFGNVKVGGKPDKTIWIDHIQEKVTLGTTTTKWQWGDEPEDPSRKLQVASYHHAVQILKENKKGRSKTALLHMKSKHPALAQMCVWITTKTSFNLVETTKRKIAFRKRKRI